MHFYSDFFFSHDMNAAPLPVKVKITPVSHDCISSKTRLKHGKKGIIVFITNLTQDVALVYCVSFPLLKEKKTFWLFNFRKLSFLDLFVLCVFFPSCWGILSDSSRTGILDALHSRHLFFLWDVPLCENSLFCLSSWSHSFSKQSPWREAIGYFILSPILCLTSWKLHTFWLILKFIHKFKNTFVSVFLL